jgi:hypothetical protein
MAGQRRSPALQRSKNVPVNPAFKLVFLSVMFLTVMFFFGALYLTSLDSTNNKNIDNLLQVSIALTSAGAGAVFGLIGGKVLP